MQNAQQGLAATYTLWPLIHSHFWSGALSIWSESKFLAAQQTHFQQEQCEVPPDPTGLTD